MTAIMDRVLMTPIRIVIVIEESKVKCRTLVSYSTCESSSLYNEIV